jgi:hypothetical protein
VLLAGALSLSVANTLCAQQHAHACAAITWDDQRLACYDQAFGAPAPPTDGASGTIEKEFGAVDASPAPKKISSIQASITAVERRRGLFVVTLDNGQAWAQTEIDSRAEVRVGDTVTVRRGMLGSYLLDTSAGIAARVKRLR